MEYIYICVCVYPAMVLDLLKKVVFIPGFMAALLDLGVSSFQTNPVGGSESNGADHRSNR